MKTIIYYQGDKSIMGSDSLDYVDGRFNIESIKRHAQARNKRFKRNFPHKLATGFRFCDEHLNEYGPIYDIPTN